MSGKQNLAWAELERRWHGIFSTLHSGGEVPPAQRLRTEGLMEAIVLLGIASPENVQDALERCYADCYGEPLRGDWRELFPFPQIPGFGQRAPVYPSTRD
jgi:hypothetical protein